MKRVTCRMLYCTVVIPSQAFRLTPEATLSAIRGFRLQAEGHRDYAGNADSIEYMM
jgi:hypothetical protein